MQHLSISGVAMPLRRRPGRLPGALPLTDKRDLYIRLMTQGMSNSEACRILGVNRRTGTRWRYGRSIMNRAGLLRVYPSITRPARPVAARFLSESERIRAVGQYRSRASARSHSADPDVGAYQLSRDSGTGNLGHSVGRRRFESSRPDQYIRSHYACRRCRSFHAGTRRPVAAHRVDGGDASKARS